MRLHPLATTTLRSLAATIIPVFLIVLTTALVTAAPIWAQQAHQQLSSDNVSAPYFLLKSQDGKTINIAEQKGRVVLLNFWAVTCVPCKAEMPTINKLYNHFHSNPDILILPIDLDNDLPNSTGFMKQNGLGLSVYTVASPVPQAFFNGLLPTTVVIDKNGRIAMYHEGGSDYGSKEFIGYIDSLSRQ